MAQPMSTLKGFGVTFKQIFQIDLAGAQDVTGRSGEANLAGAAVAKTLFVDVVSVLTAHGIAAQDIPAKLEGMAFGPDVRVGGVRQHTLWIANDNDFIATVVGIHSASETVDFLHCLPTAGSVSWLDYAIEGFLHAQEIQFDPRSTSKDNQQDNERHLPTLRQTDYKTGS